MDKWISVKDKLPESGEPVFVFYLALGFRFQGVAEYRTGKWYIEGLSSDKMGVLDVIVTHWRPQFEIPEEFQR